MSAHELPDGSVALVKPLGTGLSAVRRELDGVTVWGQVFACSVSMDPGAHTHQIAEVLAAMEATPETFDRWWLR